MEYIKFENFIKSVQYGYTADATYSEGNIQYLRITDIVPYFVDKSKVPYVLVDKKITEKYLVKKDDLLIARTGATTGYNLVVPAGFENFIFASYLVRYFYDKERLNPVYLKHVLKSQQWYGFVKNFIGGSAQPGMNPRTMGKFSFPYHEFSVQEKIANVLNSYDQLIENNNKRIKLLEQTTQEIFKEWFVRFRFPSHINVKIINGLPCGWKYIHLYEIANFQYGYSFDSSRFCENGQYPVVRIRDILENKTDTYTDESCDKKYIIKDNDILVGMDGIFHTSMWHGDSSFQNQRIVKIASKVDYVKNMFLFLSVYPQIKYWEKIISGTTVAHLGDKHLKKIKILIPTKYILEEFNKIAEPILEEINILYKKNQTLIKQRDLLLPRLMSGKLEVK